MRRLHARLILATACLLLSAPGADGQTPPGWKLAFEDYFARDELGDDWRIVAGAWEERAGGGMGDAGLYGKGDILVNRHFPGDVRVEFDASSMDPGDFSAILS